jgi:hypothetical protein
LTIRSSLVVISSNLARFADCSGAGLVGLRLSQAAPVLVAQGEPLVGAGVGPLQSERGFAQYSGVRARAMLFSLVVPSGSTSRSEKMKMNVRVGRWKPEGRRRFGGQSFHFREKWTIPTSRPVAI